MSIALAVKLLWFAFGFLVGAVVRDAVLICAQKAKEPGVNPALDSPRIQQRKESQCQS